MKRVLWKVWFVLLVLVAPAAGAAPGPTELVLSIWGGPHEHVLKATLPQFEQQNNVKITYLFNTTGDRITKLYAARGNPTIDVAIVPIDEVPGLFRDGVVLPVNPRVPNFENLVPQARMNGGYGISRLLIVLGFNTQKVTQRPTSWNDLGRPEYRGHVAIGRPPGANAYALLTILARMNGGSESNLQPGFEKLKSWRPFKAFISFFPATEPQIAAGDIWIFPEIAGLLQDFKERGGPVDFVVPQEGGVLAMNVAVIPRGVKNLALAERLVGALIGESVQRAYAARLFYGPVNNALELSPGLVTKILPQPTTRVVTMDIETLSRQKEAILEQFDKEIVGR